MDNFFTDIMQTSRTALPGITISYPWFMVGSRLLVYRPQVLSESSFMRNGKPPLSGPRLNLFHLKDLTNRFGLSVLYSGFGFYSVHAILKKYTRSKFIKSSENNNDSEKNILTRIFQRVNIYRYLSDFLLYPLLTISTRIACSVANRNDYVLSGSSVCDFIDSPPSTIDIVKDTIVYDGVCALWSGFSLYAICSALEEVQSSIVDYLFKKIFYRSNEDKSGEDCVIEDSDVFIMKSSVMVFFTLLMSPVVNMCTVYRSMSVLEYLPENQSFTSVFNSCFKRNAFFIQMTLASLLICGNVGIIYKKHNN